MSTRMVHRPARAARPLSTMDPLVLDSPPQLPDGKSAMGMQALLPMAGAGVAMSMMMFLRGSAFAALGAVVMVAALAAAGVMYLTQPGRPAGSGAAQRERYQDYLEELREELREQEQERRQRANLLDPPAAPVRHRARPGPAVGAPPRRRRLPPGAGRHRWLPVHARSSSREQGSASHPPDPFMLNEARR